MILVPIESDYATFYYSSSSLGPILNHFWYRLVRRCIDWILQKKLPHSRLVPLLRMFPLEVSGEVYRWTLPHGNWRPHDHGM